MARASELFPAPDGDQQTASPRPSSRISLFIGFPTRRIDEEKPEAVRRYGAMRITSAGRREQCRARTLRSLGFAAFGPPSLWIALPEAAIGGGSIHLRRRGACRQSMFGSPGGLTVPPAPCLDTLRSVGSCAHYLLPSAKA